MYTVESALMGDAPPQSAQSRNRVYIHIHFTVEDLHSFFFFFLPLLGHLYTNRPMPDSTHEQHTRPHLLHPPLNPLHVYQHPQPAHHPPAAPPVSGSVRSPLGGSQGTTPAIISRACFTNRSVPSVPSLPPRVLAVPRSVRTHVPPTASTISRRGSNSGHLLRRSNRANLPRVVLEWRRWC